MQGIRVLGATAIISILGCGASDPAVAMVGPTTEFVLAGDDVAEAPEPQKRAAADPAAVRVMVTDVSARRPTAAQIREAKRLLAAGEERVAAGDTAGAARAFTEALGHLENLAEAHARLASIYFRTGRVDDGVTACERALQLDPTRIDLYRTLGLLYAQANRPDAAIECLETVRDLEGLQPEVLKLLGMLNVAAGRSAEAIGPFEAYLGSNPKDTDTWVRVADLYSKSGDSKGMAVSLERALETDPSNQDLRYRLALAYAEMDETAKALHHLLVLMKEERGEPGAPTAAAPDLMRQLSQRSAEALVDDGNPAVSAPAPDEPESPALAAPAAEEPADASEALGPRSQAPSADLPDRETVEGIIEAGQAILPIDPAARYVFYVFSQEEHRRKIANAAGLGEGDAPLCVAAISSKSIPAADAQAVLSSMVAEAGRRGCGVRSVNPDVVAGLVKLGENRSAVAAVLLTQGAAGARRAEVRDAR